MNDNIKNSVIDNKDSAKTNGSVIVLETINSLESMVRKIIDSWEKAKVVAAEDLEKAKIIAIEELEKAKIIAMEKLEKEKKMAAEELEKISLIMTNELEKVNVKLDFMAKEIGDIQKTDLKSRSELYNSLERIRKPE